MLLLNWKYPASNDVRKDCHLCGVEQNTGTKALIFMLLWRCCQTNEPKHQYLLNEYFYKVTKERHSVRAASRFSSNVLRFESDLCELNRL